MAEAERAVDKLLVQGSSVPCSVCLEFVIDGGQRSIAKLKCGHLFHLDCIGSAYNAKGIMQCPNCRDIEDGQWLYANGCSSHEDIPFEDIVYDDDYDIYGVSELIFSHEHIDPINWCPYQGSYPQFSVSLEEVESSASGYPDVVVNVVYEDVSATCPFGPASESRPSRHQLGYDSVVGALRYIENESVRAEAAGPLSFTSPDARNWSHPVLPMSSPNPIDDAGSTRLIPVHERAFPYRVLTDIRVQQRSVDVSTASTIWAEPYTQGQVQSGTGLLPSSGTLHTGSGTNSRRWRNRGSSVAGRTGQTSNSHAQLNWGTMTSTGGQDAGIASMPDINWQGDQGIPWRRDGFSVYPWVVSEPESRGWTSVASSSSHNSNYYGANGIGNGAIRGTSVFQGYSTFQHDEAGDIGSMHPHSSMRPMR